MENYFEIHSDTDSNGGMVCEGEIPDARIAMAFAVMEDIRNESFVDIGSKYESRYKEQTCAIRLAGTVFFEVMTV